MSELLRVENLKQYFPVRKGILGRVHHYVKAVDDISFHIDKGEIFGLVGESGCGKSTTARSIIGLHKRTAGNIYFNGEDITMLKGEAKRMLCQEMQMIFQDPYASLNPRMTVREIIAEPLRAFGMNDAEAITAAVGELLEKVGLNKGHAARYAHEFSGGQRQRIGIARALAIKPKFIICDEPISALDVSIQAQIINMLIDLQKEFGLTYLFIAHDLSMVKYISDRIGIMYLGNIVEMGSSDLIFQKQCHPYTQALLAAIPIPDPAASDARQTVALQGDIPSPIDKPSGCSFRSRCRYAMNICAEKVPELKAIEPDYYVACHLINEEIASL
ncbi:ATP-binding cassette domain-containing protein [Fusibacter paucivorans]|uniref:ATP-binding cassette domain-containing protein n=1 Tax=Fusibacter paucivorans TaxID=76009 RepID=A0ABS5PR47_9FIRM|nr:oligopeptide/dipeptide ABC transporter ATP-binding protein [Fusibacter paucivorans]MBS7527639.1 ATP-binding cassette domain-containing protein [Fusibacter paucivorans]